jgi:ABC-type antimicrobial peptide transport system permease subunit
MLIYRVMEAAAGGVVFARVDGDAGAILPLMRSTLRQTTGRFVDVSTMQRTFDEQIRRVRRFLSVVSTLAVTGLLLAMIGVFGVLTFAATQRRQELAIRAALGAGPAAIAGVMIAPALRPVAAGIAFGGVTAFAVMRYAELLAVFR